MEERFQCRICGADEFISILEYNAPLAAQVLDRPSKDIARYPLNVVYCKNCGHIQLKGKLDINLYDNYLYTPSYAAGFVTYIEWFVDRLNEWIKKETDIPVILEIGSSNGYLLEKMKETGWRVLGIEPSKSLADVSLERGIDTINGYFSKEIVDNITARIGRPDVVVLRHVMEHLEDLNDIIIAIKQLIGDGMLLIEVPYVRKIIEEKQFYAFFHEHLSYFSVMGLNHLLSKNEFYIHRIYENTLEGGAILICATKIPEVSEGDNLQEYCSAEKAAISQEKVLYFSEKIDLHIAEIKDRIKETVTSGKSLAGWGAGQRGCTLIHLCELQSDALKYVIDVNENYWWKYIPGTDILIVPPDYYKENMVDEIIIFATGYADSIINENPEYVQLGGKFIKL